MGTESLSCKTKIDYELKVDLHEVILGITMKNKFGSEKDQNIRKVQTKEK
jgi:hypothetical protein